jgi:ParB family transcriptional regulator, chromosome partitioning protein
MNIATPVGDLRLIPLHDLQLSPLNARQIVSDEEIRAMGDSISLCGLLQNLIGLERDGKVEIVGGGKRLRALKALKSEGFVAGPGQPHLDPVPVLVTDDEDRAVAWSGAENTARTELSPADEIESYAALLARGSSVSMIAATFAVSEVHVQRRLRLARLPVPVLVNLRKGNINIDQARALTLAASDRQCIDVLEVVLSKRWSADQIRNMLTQDMVRADDRRVRYIGLDAYRAAGGSMTEDLFTERSGLHDVGLLDRLFAEKGTAEAEALRAAEGWHEAQFKLTSWYDYAWTNGLDKLSAEERELPEADAEEYEQLAEMGEHGVLSDEGLARFNELHARMEPAYSDDDLGRGVIICWVDRDGKFQAQRGYGLPLAKDTDEIAIKPAATDDTKAETIPQNLKEDLTAIRLRAIQTALFGKHELLLDLLAFSLSPYVAPWDRPLAVTAQLQKATPEKADGLNEDDRFDEDHRAQDRQMPAEAWLAFRAKGKKHRNDVLTQALARTWKLPSGDLSDLISAEIGPQVRAIWTPTAAAYLGRIPGPQLDALWAELTPAPESDPDRKVFAGLKKAEKAKKLEKLFMDMDVRETMGTSRAQNAAIDGWLPAELRFETPTDEEPST